MLTQSEKKNQNWVYFVGPMDENSNYKTSRKKVNVAKIIGPDASGRMPPNARELEEAVLGAMMLERDKIHAVIEILTEKHFYEHTMHSLIRCRFSNRGNPSGKDQKRNSSVGPSIQ